jgi:hypothetical protein
VVVPPVPPSIVPVVPPRLRSRLGRGSRYHARTGRVLTSANSGIDTDVDTALAGAVRNG